MSRKSLEEKIVAASQAATVEAIRNSPETRLTEFASLISADPVLQALTIGDLLGVSTSSSRSRSTGRAKAAKGRAASGATAPSNSAAVDTRSKAGRQAYEGSILSELRKHKGESKDAGFIRSACGGSAEQARRALNRLIEAGSVTYTGRARSTKYAAR